MEITKMYEAIETIQNYCTVRENSFSMLQECYPRDNARIQMIERDKELVSDIRECSNKIHKLTETLSFRADYSS